MSIIVPAYNVEKKLDTFFNQLFLSRYLDNLEVIIVNDGSKDRTGEVTERYHSRYPTLIRSITQSNGGHGAAMTTGIKAARGTYCRPVDGDDWLDPNGLDKTIEYLMFHADSDMIVNDFCRKNITTGDTQTKQPGLREGDLSIATLSATEPLIGYHSCVYKTKILKKVPDFDRHCFYVDNEYIAYPIPFVISIVYLPFALYVHTVGDEQQSTSITSLQHNVGNIETVILSLLSYLKTNTWTQEQFEFVSSIIINLLSLLMMVCFSMSSQQGKSIYIQICNELRTDYPDFLYSTHGKPTSVFNLFRRLNYSGYSLLRFLKKVQNGFRHGIIW